MAANPKFVNAFRAMKDLGISEVKVKPILSNLLKLHAKNWDLIEAENYRILVDTIFQNDKAKRVHEEEEEEAQDQDKLERPSKRLRLRHQQAESSPKDELVKLPEVPAPKLLRSMEGTTELCNGEMMQKEERPPISRVYTRRKTAIQAEIESLSMEITEEDSSRVTYWFEERGKSLDSKRSLPEACIEEPRTEQGLESPKRKIACSEALFVSEEEPPTDDSVLCDVPLAVLLPPTTDDSVLYDVPLDPEMRNDGSSQKTREHSRGDFPATSGIRTDCEHTRVQSESSSQLEVATSPLGEVKLNLSCTSSRRSDFHMPDIDTVVKLVEDRCLQSYKITDPAFSVMKVMKDICECFLQLGLDKSETKTQTSSKADQSETFSSANVENGTNGNGSHQQNEQNNVQDYELTADQICSRNDVIDICKGNEKVVISLVNDVNNEPSPSFHYISKNVVFQNAYVNFSLARIGDGNSCSHCVGDCLTLPIPCACAHETGGEFVYTAEGLVKEEFLEECVSMNRDPEKHCQFFCEECPLERSKKEEIIEPCKGHLMRRFIKECWWKCGCSQKCGNRVVQQGITRNLQVFMTKGKGWALRTVEDLPKGAFVCEYVGEVLTNTELSDRISDCPEGEKHSYPVLLDADWGSEGVLNDEEALCLDATYYGNVGRFINHRCFDSTLVEIPVEIETPDHHYYHLAFFTSRKVKAMEELTWDYGINFGDRKHPVKAFRCQCGSRFCRNTRRPRKVRFGRRR